MFEVVIFEPFDTKFAQTKVLIEFSIMTTTKIARVTEKILGIFVANISTTLQNIFCFNFFLVWGKTITNWLVSMTTENVILSWYSSD